MSGRVRSTVPNVEGLQPARKIEPHAIGAPLRINLEGPPEVVAQLLKALANAFSPDDMEPTQLYIPVPEAARRTGISEDRLRGLVKAGRLTNYNAGSGARILLSLADVRQAAQE